MRQDFNYHTHTYRCGHASMDSDEQYIQAAIKAGFKIIGMSDHAPYPDRSKKTDRMDFDELEGYYNSIKSLKEKYKDQIDVKIGVEMEYFPCYDQYIDTLFDKFDYVLLGQHYPSADANHEYCHDSNSDELVRKYGHLICEGLRKHKFLYLAHPDYFCGGIYQFNDTFKEVVNQICQCCVETDTPMEVNVKLTERGKKVFCDGKEQFVYPLRAFWEIASKYPIKCIYGFDAHKSDLLLMSDYVYKLTDEILKDLPLEFVKEPLF